MIVVANRQETHVQCIYSVFGSFVFVHLTVAVMSLTWRETSR